MLESAQILRPAKIVFYRANGVKNSQLLVYTFRENPNGTVL
jgi:hypothetical protein